MCGIAGIISADGSPVDRSTLDRMTDTLILRGPDGRGTTLFSCGGFGHRRLSIVDLVAGQQPMATSDGRYTITFNGEIYNFLKLRADLEKSGTQFRTHSDTEVLLELFVRDGANCLNQLNGMFAFAIWDEQKKTLFAARDRFGKKPFYYTQTNRGLIFGSELKTLFAHPDVGRDVDENALQAYLFFETVPAPLSLIKGIHKLSAAHCLIYQNGKLSTHRYWDMPAPEQGFPDERLAAKTLLQKLDAAVEQRLISDVPLGVFLSGGIDSSAVVAMMARHREGQNIQTFSIGFEEASYDETPYVEMVAQKFGTNHHTAILSGKDLLEIFITAMTCSDEPLADGSLIPTYLLSRFTRQHVTVALGGDGGDELFAGYPTFFADRYANTAQHLPDFLKNFFIKIASLIPTSEKNMSLDFKLRQFFSGLGFSGPKRHAMWLAALPPQLMTQVLSEDLRHKISSKAALDMVSEELERYQSLSVGDQLLRFYQKFYLGDVVLTKVDRASMANSLEVRAPFLDIDLVEYVAKLPYEYKLKGVTTKYLLKRALNRTLPAAITQRPKKGFGIPIAGWFKRELNPLLREQLSKERLRADGFFNPEFVTKLIDEHTAGKSNHRKPLLTLLAFQLWRNQWF